MIIFEILSSVFMIGLAACVGWKSYREYERLSAIQRDIARKELMLKREKKEIESLIEKADNDMESIQSKLRHNYIG